MLYLENNCFKMYRKETISFYYTINKILWCIYVEAGATFCFLVWIYGLGLTKKVVIKKDLLCFIAKAHRELKIYNQQTISFNQ